MSTKILTIGPAEREQKDIQIKINIIVKSIYKYKAMLDSKEFLQDEILITIKSKIAQEELNLQKFKELYPEHFI